MSFSQPSRIDFALPAWLEGHGRGYRETRDLRSRMAFVIETSRQNVERGSGGPFAAAVFERDSGALVSLGVNLVTSRGLSILHAELVALSLAEIKLGGYDLGRAQQPALELFSSTEPCAMCLGAIPWSGVGALVTAASDGDARAIGFDEGAKPADWKAGLQERGIGVTDLLLRERAVQVLRRYREIAGPIY